MVSSALASRTLTPSGRLWRPKRSCGRILSNHAVLTQTYSSKTKKPRYREALLVLVGPGGFEPPTSTMSTQWSVIQKIHASLKAMLLLRFRDAPRANL